jgi:hypothetical protein
MSQGLPHNAKHILGWNANIVLVQGQLLQHIFSAHQIINIDFEDLMLKNNKDIPKYFYKILHFSFTKN